MAKYDRGRCSRLVLEKKCSPVGAILILLRLLAHNFIFGAEANISARAEVRQVIATKFQPGRAEIRCNQALSRLLKATNQSERI